MLERERIVGAGALERDAPDAGEEFAFAYERSAHGGVCP
jgi:hypothetical protein